MKMLREMRREERMGTKAVGTRPILCKQPREGRMPCVTMSTILEFTRNFTLIWIFRSRNDGALPAASIQPTRGRNKGNKTKTSCALIKEYIRKTGWVTGAGWRLFKFSSSCFSSTIYIHSVRCIIQRYKHIASNILLFTRQRNIGRQHKDVWPSERFR